MVDTIYGGCSITLYAVETRGLVKAYGSKRAVDGLDMCVPPGSVYGFVGKNGAGKSTTMKMIAGLARPTSGSMLLFDADISRSRRKARPVGALIENPGLAPNLSATDNLMVKARAMGVSKARAHCAGLLDLVGLAEVAGKKVKGFSLGMKQRMGIALALVGDPQLLLLDEPLNGLDPEATREMRTCIGRLASERGVTVVISSHVLDQLNRVADRFGVISDGRMVAEFTDEEMQAACGHSVRVRATEPERARQVLQVSLPAGASVTQAADGALDVAFASGAPDVLAVSQALHDADVVLLELVVVNRDIEDYFVELMERGARHA